MLTISPIWVSANVARRSRAADALTSITGNFKLKAISRNFNSNLFFWRNLLIDIYTLKLAHTLCFLERASMSNNNELLTDDYVADLLAQEASDCSLKYSAMGMDAYRTNKK